MVAVADAVTPELAAFLRQVFKPGRDPFDVIADITDALDGQDRVLRTIRPNDLAPEISQFQQVTDEIKPKARNAPD